MSPSLRRIAGWSAVVATPFALASGILLLVALRRPFAEFGIARVALDPGLSIAAGPEAAGLLRWGYLADMFGFYLLLLPFMLALREALAARTDASLARLAQVCGVVYVTIGAAGAAILAAVTPDLLEASTGGSPEVRAAARITFSAVTEGVQRGMWQSAEAIPLIGWLFLTGLLLHRAGAPALGWTGMALGALGVVGVLGSLLELAAPFLAGFAFLAPMPLWVLALGLRLLRDPGFPAG